MSQDRASHEASRAKPANPGEFARADSRASASTTGARPNADHGAVTPGRASPKMILGTLVDTSTSANPPSARRPPAEPHDGPRPGVAPSDTRRRWAQDAPTDRAWLDRLRFEIAAANLAAELRERSGAVAFVSTLAVAAIALALTLPPAIGGQSSYQALAFASGQSTSVTAAGVTPASVYPPSRLDPASTRATPPINTGSPTASPAHAGSSSLPALIPLATSTVDEPNRGVIATSRYADRPIYWVGETAPAVLAEQPIAPTAVPSRASAPPASATATPPANDPTAIAPVPSATATASAAVLANDPTPSPPTLTLTPAGDNGTPDSPTLIYTVVPGDTLAALAARFGVSQQSLATINSLASPDSLAAGQQLKIVAPGGNSYTVTAGDTLVSLADRFGVIPEEVASVNHLTDPFVIYPGQKLSIPAVSSAERDAAAAPEPAPANTPQPSARYTVVAGDTLSGIARRLGVSVDTLASSSAIDPTANLEIGQTLAVPSAGGALYVVQPGDTVSSVAARYGASAVELIRVNGLAEPYLLDVGRRLTIPGSASPVGAPVPPAATETATATATIPPARPATATPTPVLTRPTATPRPRPTFTPTPRPAPTNTPVAPKVAIGPQVASLALRYQGSRYAWGGASPATGFDCSGFVMYVLRQAGVAVPRDLWGQSSAGPSVARDALQPGDLVFFKDTYRPGLSHDGIYLGGSQFVHAASDNTGVMVSRLDTGYWNAHYSGASRPY